MFVGFFIYFITAENREEIRQLEGLQKIINFIGIKVNDNYGELFPGVLQPLLPSPNSRYYGWYD